MVPSIAANLPSRNSSYVDQTLKPFAIAFWDFCSDKIQWWTAILSTNTQLYVAIVAMAIVRHMHVSEI